MEIEKLFFFMSPLLKKELFQTDCWMSKSKFSLQWPSFFLDLHMALQKGWGVRRKFALTSLSSLCRLCIAAERDVVVSWPDGLIEERMDKRQLSYSMTLLGQGMSFETRKWWHPSFNDPESHLWRNYPLEPMKAL